MATIRRAALILAAMVLMPHFEGRAQQAPRDFFSEPILVLDAVGHHAPVRSLVFDGPRLLSGGMDKVIHAWDFDGDPPRPMRTLRPPIHRGYRGQVNALALSPVADARGQRLLAVAGYGVLGESGEILLFEYPGPAGQGTGDVVAQLPAADAAGVFGPGHSNPVTALAFSPDGRVLASASVDRTVRLWDVAGRRQRQVLSESRGPVNALAYFAGGTRLASGGRDGVLRLYDVTDPALPRLIARTAPVLRPGSVDPSTAAIIALAASPDGRSIVVGTEGGSLIRHDASNLAGVFLKAPGGPNGAVLAVAIGPDGRSLAVATVARFLADGGERPEVSCLVELRSMADGAVIERLANASNLVHALAFSPDGRRLAFSGGDAQAVSIKALGPNSPPVDERRGPGSSLWDVGFRQDGRAIRFARTRDAAPGKAARYETFDLRTRRLLLIEPGEPAYRHANASESGWTIRPVGIHQLDFVDAMGRGWRGELDPDLERRWWSFTLIPPDAAAGHADPVAAVGCETGVAFWNLANGRPTRFFAGHEGPVYALASSTDGRWLVTGSSDQTARLWPLLDCDKPAPFGARFLREADGAWAVNAITPGGFADGIGLKTGHVIDEFYVGDQRKNPAEFLPKLDSERATRFYTFQARMRPDGEPIRVGATKRDHPALSLFPGEDGEWVLWTPRGYYDTSIAGDRRHLGWLTNRGTAARLLAGTWDTIDKFERKYRQPKAPAPNVIDRLLDTADPVAALAALPPADPLAADPTNSRLDELAILPALALAPAGPRPPALAVRYRAAAARGAALIARASLSVDGRIVAPVAMAGPSARVEGELAVPIGSGPIPVVSLVVEDEKGVRRSRSIEISPPGPPHAPSRRGRLEIVAIGAETFSDKRLDRIPYAARDVEALARFLRDRWVDPSSAAGSRFEADRVQIGAMIGPTATAQAIGSALDDLRAEARDGRLAADDAVAVVIESHYLEIGPRRWIATPEADDGHPVPPAFSAAELADRLGELSAVGCRVIVLIDAVHPIRQEGWDHDVKEWVRHLQSRSGVAAFIASEHEPSLAGLDGHRVFARGILDVLKPRSAARGPRKPGPMSTFDFQRTVIDSVYEQSDRRQRAQFYLPDGWSIRAPLLDPTPIGGLGKQED